VVKKDREDVEKKELVKVCVLSVVKINHGKMDRDVGIVWTNTTLGTKRPNIVIVILTYEPKTRKQFSTTTVGNAFAVMRTNRVFSQSIM
jgi:hypothetical protein